MTGNHIHVLEKYLILKTRLLGEGSFGKIYMAHDKISKKNVAVKISEHKNGTRDIINECNILRNISHEHIISVSDFYISPSISYMFMPLLMGGDMFYLTEKHEISEHTSKIIFKQLVSAVEYCHHHDIIHRDIKLENIVLKEAYDPRNINIMLIDFGMATIQHINDPPLDTYPGSPYYASPELINITPYSGRKNDIWSMGVTLYALVARSLPFYSNNYDDVIKIVNNAEPDYDHLPEILVKLLKGMLNKNPLLRYDIDQIKASDWICEVDNDDYSSGTHCIIS